MRYPRRRLVVVLVAALAVVAVAPGADAAASVEVRRDVQYGEANGKRLLLDAYLPPSGGGRRPAVVMIHGGGWRAGDKASWGEEASRFAERGWVAFSINYRLDEPSPFPAEVDDVQTSVRWARSHAGEYGVDPARIAALGESAGGHLTAMLATLGDGPLDDGARIRVGAAWSPPVDLTALAGSRGGEWATRVIGCTLQTCPDRLAQASPVTHVDRSDAPLYLVNSTEELVPLSQAQSMAARLTAAGVDHQLDVLPGARHALDFRQEAWAPTVAFLEKHLSASPESQEEPDGSFPVGVLAVTVVLALLGTGATVVLLKQRAPTTPTYDPGLHARPDSRGQVIIEFLAFLTTMMAAMMAMMDEMIDLVQGLFGS